MVFVIEHHSNHIQRCLLAVAAADEWNLRARHHQRGGNEKLVALQSEVGDAQIQGEIRGRQFGSEFLLAMKQVPISHTPLIARHFRDLDVVFFSAADRFRADDRG